MTYKSAVKLIAAAALSTALAIPAFAAEYKAGNVTVKTPWIKATVKGAKVGGGYMKIENTGKTDDRLVSGSLTKSGKTEIHEMGMNNGIMMMKQLKNGLVIKAGKSAELKPGSFHMMFMGLKEPLKAGDKVQGELVFEKAGKVTIEYAVKPMKAMKKMNMKDMPKSGRGSMHH